MTLFETPSNMTHFGDLLNHTNNVTSGYLGIIMTIVIFFVTLMISSSFGTLNSVLVASFITLILAVLLAVIGLVNSVVVTTLSIIWIILLVVVYAVGGRDSVV